MPTHHADKQPGLLSGTSDTGITDNSNRKARSETGETNGKSSPELNESGVQRHRRSDCLRLSVSVMEKQA